MWPCCCWVGLSVVGSVAKALRHQHCSFQLQHDDEAQLESNCISDELLQHSPGDMMAKALMISDAIFLMYLTVYQLPTLLSSHEQCWPPKRDMLGNSTRSFSSSTFGSLQPASSR